MEIFKTFTFEAAHRLPHVPPGHKCGRLHGHSYVVTVRLRGDVDAKAGWVRDLGDVSAAFRPIFDRLDHHELNGIPGLENPTNENLVRWVWRQVAPALPELAEISVQETAASGCVYRGEDEAAAAKPRGRRSVRR